MAKGAVALAVAVLALVVPGGVQAAPPANDGRRGAQPLRKLPASVKGSTLGATTDASDPKACGLVGGSVWYAISPGAAARLLFRLHANGDLDASLVVLQRIRSQVEVAG